MSLIILGTITCFFIFLGFRKAFKPKKKYKSRFSSKNHSVQKNKKPFDLQKYKEMKRRNLAVGRSYERQIGKMYEERGYNVTYFGAIKGIKDLGRDLIVKSPDETFIVQAKCLKKERIIHIKHIIDLHGTTDTYRKENPNEKNIQGVFITTATYGKEAQEKARLLNIKLVSLEANNNYAFIKCNINLKGEKIYHLPEDPYYDKVRISLDKNEFYASSTSEAEAAGFRRAKNIKTRKSV